MGQTFNAGALAAAGTDLSAPGRVTVSIGGEVRGTASQIETMGDVAGRFARERGIKSFAVEIDGVRATTDMAKKPLTGVRSMEIIPKDSRACGLRRR